jgi:RHS repeat-associated protein
MLTKHAIAVLTRLTLIALLLAVAVLPAYAWQDYHPDDSPGPACTCSSPDGNGDGGGGAPVCGGKPIFSVNQFTGDLIVTDMPATYDDPSGGPPFVMTWSAQSVDSATTSKLGPGWTHSFDFSIEILDQEAGGINLHDGNGRVTHFSMSGSGSVPAEGRACGVMAFGPIGNRTSWEVHRPDPNALILTFDGTGHATGFKNADGQVWTFGYASGRLATVTDPHSRVTTFSYNGDGTLYRVTLPAGRYAQFTYDTNNPKRLSTVRDAAGDIYTFGYSGTDKKIARLIDPSAREFDFLYQTFSSTQAIATISVAGLASSARNYYYQDDGTLHQRYLDVVETKDGLGRTTRFTYDKSTAYYGTLQAITQDNGGLNLTQNFAYTASHKLAKYRDSWQPEQTGAKEHRHWFFYTDANHPEKVTWFVDAQNYNGPEPPPTYPPWTPYDANGNETCPSYQFQYNADGNLTRVITPEDREVDIAYVSGRSRISSVTIQDQNLSGGDYDHRTDFTYWDSSKGYQLKTVADARGNTTTFYYDSNWYLDYIDPPVGNNIDVTADAYGDITAITDGNGNTTSFVPDALHRLTRITFPNIGSGSTKNRDFTWDCCGLTQITDENGVVTKLEYDQYTKWLKKVTEDYGTGKLNYATQYTYDEVGNLKTVTNARSKVTTYTYDDADRLTQASYPDGTSEAWTYHDDGRVATHRDGRNRTITYHYDADDRLATVGTLKAVDYPTDTDVGIVRDKDGLVTSLADATGTSTATYYPSGWLKTFTNGASSLNKTTFEYNHVGLLSKLTAPVTSKYFTYDYNELNQLRTVQDSSTPPITLSSFSYDNGGRLSRIARPGSYIEFAYNARDWIAAVRNRKTDDTVLYDNTYYYQDGSLWDFVGNPLKRTEFVDGTTYTTTYRYDNVYRMLSEARTPGNYSLAYTYDQVGNRLTRVKDGVTTSYGYDNNDKLTTVNSVTSAGYDGSGNLTSTYGNFPAMTLAYNDASQLTSVAYPGGTDTFQWNALGQRMRANLNGTVFRYIYAGDRVLERTNDTNGTLARYTPADASYYAPLLYFKHNDGTQHYPMADIVGTSRRLLSETATVTDTYSLDAFGRQMSASGSTVNPYRFGAAWGYTTDTPGSGLLQLGARFYWPEVGRFIQQDPAGDGMNWYAYAGNNPAAWVDPTGLYIQVVGDLESVNAAFDYLRQDPVIAALIDSLEKSPLRYTIHANACIGEDVGTPYWNPNYPNEGGVVSWNPNLGLHWPGGTMSPAVALAHELAHASENYFLFYLLLHLGNPRGYNLEEWRAMQYEQHASRTLGEDVRPYYGGWYHPVTSVTSTHYDPPRR